MIRIKVDGKDYEGFSNVNINLSFDSLCSTFSFDGYFDPDNDVHRELFKPLGFKSIEIYEDKTRLLTGTILNHRYTASSKNNLVPVSGYSKTGVLGDVSIPTDLYPLETINKSLKEITERLIKPFGISLVIKDEVKDEAFKLYSKSSSDGKGSIGEYLASLASQRNITLSHDAFGNLVFTRPKKSKVSIATYIENVPNVEMTIDVNGQSMHSEIEVIRQSSATSDAEGKATKKNGLISDYRPLVKEQTKGEAGDTEKANNNALAAELQSIALNITTDRWTWFDGSKVSILQPNNYITAVSKACFLSKPSIWFVQSVTLTEEDKGRKAILTCVMPESFNGETPKNIFS